MGWSGECRRAVLSLHLLRCSLRSAELMIIIAVGVVACTGGSRMPVCCCDLRSDVTFERLIGRGLDTIAKTCVSVCILRSPYSA